MGGKHQVADVDEPADCRHDAEREFKQLQAAPRSRAIAAREVGLERPLRLVPSCSRAASYDLNNLAGPISVPRLSRSVMWFAARARFKRRARWLSCRAGYCAPRIWRVRAMIIEISACHYSKLQLN